MSKAGADSGLDATEAGTPGASETRFSLSPAQRTALANICRLHERGVSPKRFNWRTHLFTLYIAFALGFCVLLQFMTAFAGPAYLLLGFVLGVLLKELRGLMSFRQVWPVYEAIIDWPRAFGLLKPVDRPRSGDGFQGDA
jgi:hypothetical protein